MISTQPRRVDLGEKVEFCVVRVVPTCTGQGKFNVTCWIVSIFGYEELARADLIVHSSTVQRQVEATCSDFNEVVHNM